jgi:hypothetical protein
MTDSFAIRNLSFGLPQVRHSKFVIRHCPDPHDATGRFDFVLANPPFNVNAVDKERLKDMAGPGRRFPFGLPRTDNATATRASAKTIPAKPDRRSVGETELHCLLIQLFHTALNEKGRAGFGRANSASDARSSEHELRRQKLVEDRAAKACTLCASPGELRARQADAGQSSDRLKRQHVGIFHFFPPRARETCRGKTTTAFAPSPLENYDHTEYIYEH